MAARQREMCGLFRDAYCMGHSEPRNVFVCLRCASVHRSLGTHISKPKGCTGTYLWGPDELDAMRPGNRAANRALLGDPAARLTPDVSDAALREHLVDKYEKKRWAPPAVQPPEPPDLMTFDDPSAAGGGLLRLVRGLRLIIFSVVLVGLALAARDRDRGRAG